MLKDGYAFANSPKSYLFPMPLIFNWNCFKEHDLSDRISDEEYTEFEKESISRYLESFINYDNNILREQYLNAK